MALIKLNNQSYTSGSSFLPSGSILQVQSTLVTSASSQSISSATDTNISGLNVTITPSSTSSKILLLGRCIHEMSQNHHECQFFFRRGSTKFNVGDTAGNRAVTMAMPSISFHANYDSTMDTADMITIDSNHNTTSAITYHIAMSHNQGGTLYVNRVLNNGDLIQYERASSEIIAMEIKG